MEGANAGSTRGQVLRFGALGGANTRCTTAAFYLLAWVLPAEVAFTIVYAAGIVVRRPDHSALRLPRDRVLVARGSLSPAGTWPCTSWAWAWWRCSTRCSDAPRIVVVLGTVAVTAPLSFLGARLLFVRGASARGR